MNDLISRQAAIDAFQKELCVEREYATPFISFKGCERILNELPSAGRRGRWIGDRLIYPSGIITFIYLCSECGYKERHTYEDTKPSNYCPNCGASMMDDNAIQHTKCVGNALDALDEVEE